jgi:hypothetical protein
MGRRPKKASERKSQYIPFLVSKAQLKAYKAAADEGFKGNVSDVLRAAADALAAQLVATAKQTKRELGERDAVRNEAADAPEQFERDKPGTSER